MSKKLFRSTSIVALMTMLSRVLGFARDVIFAGFFGAGTAFDAFVIAFKLPNFMRRLFGEGAFSQAFVPVLAEYKENESHSQVRQFIDRVAGCLSLALLVVVIIGELAAPGVITLFAPGFLDEPDRFHLAIALFHRTFPYLLFIALTAFAAAVLNTYSHFAMPALAPVLLNLTFIVVCLFWAPHTATPVMTLGWGVFLAGILQLAVQLPLLWKYRVMPRPRLGWHDPGVRRVLKLMLPALFGVSVAQVSLLVDSFFASFLPAGSISWLYYSDRLTYLPLGVIGVAISTVVLPYLSKQTATKSEGAYSATLTWALKSSLLVGVPSAVGLFVLAGPILATLIGHGAFTEHDVLMTRLSLMAFSAGLPAFMLVKILASGFYSRQNIKTPVKIAALCMLLNIVLNLLLIRPMAHAGLALSTSLSSILNAVLLWVGLLKQRHLAWDAAWRQLLWQVFLAALVMAGLLYYLAGGMTAWFAMHIWQRVGHLSADIALAMAVYVAVLWLLGLRLRHISAPEVMS
jgi:putative peptidoglycan lipid II flippase